MARNKRIPGLAPGHERGSEATWPTLRPSPAQAHALALQRRMGNQAAIAHLRATGAWSSPPLATTTQHGTTTRVDHPEVAAHEAVHRQQFALTEAGAPPAPVGALEAEAQRGSAALLAGRPFQATLGAPRGATLAYTPPHETECGSAWDAAEFARYRVRKGQTLSTIAKLATGDPGRVTELLQVNTVHDPDVIQEGQLLNIPPGWALPAEMEACAVEPTPRRSASGASAPFWRMARAIVSWGGMSKPEPALPGVAPECAPVLHPYRDQLDNQVPWALGRITCSPTSFTMALLDVYGGDAEAMKARTRELIEERNGTSTYAQPEELVMELLRVVDWEAATRDKPEFFWNPDTFVAWAHEQYNGGVKIYKDPNAQQYVASLYAGVGNTKAVTYKELYTQKDWAPIIEHLRQGHMVTVQGGFTGSGHVVYVVSADANGIVVHDPYGMYVAGKHVRNGTVGRSPRVLSREWREEARRRASHNRTLAGTVEKMLDTELVEPYHAWGQSNRFTWKEVTALRIGRWFSVLAPA